MRRLANDDQKNQDQNNQQIFFIHDLAFKARLLLYYFKHFIIAEFYKIYPVHIFSKINRLTVC